MSDIWHEYLEVMSNPGHSLAEGTWTLGEFILFSVIWAKIVKPAWYRMIRREHKIIDLEHGHNHIKTTKEVVDAVLHPHPRRPMWYQGVHRAIME